MLNFELHFCFLLLHIKQLCSEMVAYFFHPHSLSAPSKIFNQRLSHDLGEEQTAGK